jgi:hypothetical protein
VSEWLTALQDVAACDSRRILNNSRRQLGHNGPLTNILWGWNTYGTILHTVVESRSTPSRGSIVEGVNLLRFTIQSD